MKRSDWGRHGCGHGCGNTAATLQPHGIPQYRRGAPRLYGATSDRTGTNKGACPLAERGEATPPGRVTAGLLHCVRKDGARRSFQDTCYRMANRVCRRPSLPSLVERGWGRGVSAEGQRLPKIPPSLPKTPPSIPSGMAVR
jgi:hypothetical protein